MSTRLHVATTYNVEYGKGFFDNEVDETNILLSELCPNAQFDCDEICWSKEIEIQKNELIEALNKVKTDLIKYDDILKSRNVSYNASEFCVMIEEFISKSDNNNDYVKLSWF